MPKKTYVLDEWRGLNEAPDGDTGLLLGEASVQRDIRVTRDRNLQQRPGYMTLHDFGAPVRGLWIGSVKGEEVTLVVSGGKLWRFDGGDGGVTELGAVEDADTDFFEFGGKAYLLNGLTYRCWDGGRLTKVADDAYVPLVLAAASPSGGGTELQQLNLLTGRKRASYSVPDAGAAVFQLPEKSIDAVESVKVNGGLTAAYTSNLSAGTVTLTAAAAKGDENVVIQWRKDSTADLKAISGMRHSEVYGGANDSRVFFYGDGSNKMYHSGLSWEGGQPDASYFPALGVVAVDVENQPVTALCRQYASMVVFKEGSAYICNYEGGVQDAQGMAVPAFPVLPLNRAKGCSVMNGVAVVNNNPVTVSGDAAYEWVSTSVRDERNAKPISGRAEVSLRRLLSSGQGGTRPARLFDYEAMTELWIMRGGEAVIYNYGEGVDAWYTYTSLPVDAFVAVSGRVILFGGADGRLCGFSSEHRSDDGRPVRGRFEGGSEDYNEFFRLHSTKYWNAVMKPVAGARMKISVVTDRGIDGDDAVTASCSLLDYGGVDYGNWSYNTNRMAQNEGFKIDMRKWSFMKLIIESFGDASSTFTLCELAHDVSVGARAR